jgi:hypothetical protein
MSTSEPALGALALTIVLFLVVIGLALSVKLRAFSTRGFGVRVYDIGADLELPAALRSRSYRFALYLTMKSLPREPASAGVASPQAASRAPLAVSGRVGRTIRDQGNGR